MIMMGSQLQVSGSEHERKFMRCEYYIKDTHRFLAYINNGFEV